MSKKLSKKEEMKLKLTILEAEYVAMENLKATSYNVHAKDLSRTAISTLYHQQLYLDTLIVKICKLVERLKKDGVSVHRNETALRLYWEYSDKIHLGLF